MMAGVPYECELVREQLPEYAEGTLTGRELARVEQHVSSCERCQGEVADLRLVISAVRSVPADEVPDTLAPRIRRAVQQRAPARGARLLWPRLAIPVAVLTGVIAVSFALRAPQQQFAPGAGAIPTPAAPELAQKAAERGVAGGAGGVGTGAAAPEAEPLPRANIPAERSRIAPAPMPPALLDQAQVAAKPELPQQQLARAKAAPQPAEAAPAPAPPPSADQMQVAGKVEAQQPPPQEFAGPPVHKARSALGQQEGGAQGGGAGMRPPSRQRASGGLRGPRGPGGEPRSGRAAMGPGPHPSRPAYADRRGLYARRRGRERPGPQAEEQAGGLAAASEATAEAAGAPPVFARATLVKGAGQSMIALVVASGAPTDTITLRLAGGPARSYEWRSAGTRPATIPLPLDKIGAGPASVPVEVTSSAGKRDYILFVPAMSRLGEVAPSAPVASYQAAPLRTVLSDLSKMTGLVILAEEPLDGEVKGGIPRGTPAASLRKLGEASGFEVEAQGDLVFTLTHRR